MSYDAIVIGQLLQETTLRVANAPGEIKLDGFFLRFDSESELSDIETKPGGSAARIAWELASLGLKTALVAKVGGDETGQRLVKVLKIKKVATEFVVTDPAGRTGSEIYLLDGEGRRAELIFAGVGQEFRIADLPITKFAASWVYLDSLNMETQKLEQAIDKLKKKKIKLALRVDSITLAAGLKQLLPILRQLDLLLLGRVSAHALLGETKFEAEMPDLLDSLSVTTPARVVIVDGQNGAFGSSGVDEEQARFWATPLTTNSAVNDKGHSDIFTAGLLAGLIKYDNLQTALQLATLAAAGEAKIIVRTKGRLKRWPDKSQLEKIRVSRL